MTSDDLKLLVDLHRNDCLKIDCVYETYKFSLDEFRFLIDNGFSMLTWDKDYYGEKVISNDFFSPFFQNIYSLDEKVEMLFSFFQYILADFEKAMIDMKNSGMICIGRLYFIDEDKIKYIGGENDFQLIKPKDDIDILLKAIKKQLGDYRSEEVELFLRLKNI
jgi:hypothetical protein